MIFSCFLSCFIVLAGGPEKDLDPIIDQRPSQTLTKKAIDKEALQHQIGILAKNFYQEIEKNQEVVLRHDLLKSKNKPTSYTTTYAEAEKFKKETLEDLDIQKGILRSIYPTLINALSIMSMYCVQEDHEIIQDCLAPYDSYNIRSLKGLEAFKLTLEKKVRSLENFNNHIENRQRAVKASMDKRMKKKHFLMYIQKTDPSLENLLKNHSATVNDVIDFTMGYE